MTSDDPRSTDTPDPWAPGAGTPASTRPRRRGLIVTAVVIFSLGVVFTILAALTPFVLGRDAPTFLYVAAMVLTPVGFLLGLLHAILGSRAPRM